MRKNVIFLFIILFFTACSAPNNALDRGEQPNTQPIHYETEAERKERESVRDQTIGEQGGYTQSKQPHLKQIDEDKDYTNPYTDEDSLLLTEELNKLDYLAAVEVASSEDTIIIGVMLKDVDSHKQISDEKFSERIKNEVRKVLPETDKEIIVFTQEAEWGEWKNLDSRISPE